MSDKKSYIRICRQNVSGKNCVKIKTEKVINPDFRNINIIIAG